jgi:heat shock protein HtpX
MPSAFGLSTYRWNNNIKSMVLLAMFPFLLLGLVGAFFLIAGVMCAQQNGFVDPAFAQSLGIATAVYSLTPAQLAAQGMLAYWPITLGVATLWLAVGYLFNGAMIRAATGARRVERSEEPRLYNLVENLCISRGLPPPPLYVVDTGAMNAFASGINESSYSITVTRGLLERLDDAELEAVLAHELTHIMNRDVRLLIISVVFTGMLSFMAQMMWRSLRFAGSGASRNRDGDRRGALPLMLLAAILLVIGYLFALLLRFALSRKREHLADAGSVELTKNPEALISALEKISGNAEVPNVPPEVQQLFIENPPSLFGLFDTHPPIAERIRVLRELGGLPPQGASIIPKAG